MTDVPAILTESLDGDVRTPGMFCFERNDRGLFYLCPCGCGREGYLPFDAGSDRRWKWDGNREKPSLVPSVWHVIHRRDGTRHTHWHGFLIAGVWRTVER